MYSVKHGVLNGIKCYHIYLKKSLVSPTLLISSMLSPLNDNKGSSFMKDISRTQQPVEILTLYFNKRLNRINRLPVHLNHGAYIKTALFGTTTAQPQGELRSVFFSTCFGFTINRSIGSARILLNRRRTPTPSGSYHFGEEISLKIESKLGITMTRGGFFFLNRLLERPIELMNRACLLDNL